MHPVPLFCPAVRLVHDLGTGREKSGKTPQRKIRRLIKGRVNYPRATPRTKIEILPFIELSCRKSGMGHAGNAVVSPITSSEMMARGLDRLVEIEIVSL